jgi:hypothetical protein
VTGGVTTPSHLGFLTPIPPGHAEAEWAFDLGHSYNFIQELRFSKADDLWLSPAYQRDSIWISLYNIDRHSSASR